MNAEDIFRSFFGGRSQAAGQSPFGFGFDPFTAQDIFGQARGARQAPSNVPEDGGDVISKVLVSFMDAIKGVKRTLSYTSWAECGSCHGTGLKGGTKPRQCSACGGSGEQILSRGGFRVMMTCNQCGGAGYSISSSDVCGSCAGEGRVCVFDSITQVLIRCRRRKRERRQSTYLREWILEKDFAFLGADTQDLMAADMGICYSTFRLRLQQQPKLCSSVKAQI